MKKIGIIEYLDTSVHPPTQTQKSAAFKKQDGQRYHGTIFMQN